MTTPTRRVPSTILQKVVVRHFTHPITFFPSGSSDACPSVDIFHDDPSDHDNHDWR